MKRIRIELLKNRKWYSLSGRDVKQILKLAGLVSYARKLPAIDVATIEYCMRFKPTEKISNEKK